MCIETCHSRRVEGQATRLPLARFAMLELMLAGAIVTFGAPDLLACSGPGAASTMRESALIGLSLWGISLAIVAFGCTGLLRTHGRRIPLFVAPLWLHPGWWMSATHGDCGEGLRWCSFVATLCVAATVACAICWPRRAEAEPKKWKWALSGALIGTLVGLPIAGLMLEGPGQVLSMNLTLAGLFLCSMVITGTLVGVDLFRLRTRSGHRFRLSLRTLLSLPFVLTPLFVVLLPVLPYQASVSMTSPFNFVVVDDAMGRPIPNAALRLIDPRFALDDAENQGSRVVTGTAGSVEYYLFANSHGREGLLGQTETITYNPWLIQVEALAYRPFFTSLANDPPIPLDRFTARLLGLTFPPPPSVTIRLSPRTSTDAEGAVQ